MHLAEKLLKMKEKIDRAKPDVARLEGSRDQLYKTLKKNHGCKTLKDVEKKLKATNKELDQKKAALAKGIANLEEKYDWS